MSREWLPVVVIGVLWLGMGLGWVLGYFARMSAEGPLSVIVDARRKMTPVTENEEDDYL